MRYLDLLESVLAAGLPALSAPFITAQVRYLEARQLPEGGFRGREGPADLYYTDFAVRALALLAPASPALARVPAWLEEIAPRAATVLDCFCLLNSSRLLGRLGHPVSLPDLAPVRDRRRLPEGGWARPQSDRLSAYDTFLAALCCELEDAPFPAPAPTARALVALQTPQGGFTQSPSEPAPQTSATAAAVAVLLLTGRLTPPQATAAARFLAAQQTPAGGLRAHPDAATADLLSTFTGLVTLTVLDAASRLDLPALGRFLRETTLPEGGFRGTALDPEGDVEYTYYGVGTLALLAGYVDANR